MLLVPEGATAEMVLVRAALGIAEARFETMELTAAAEVAELEMVRVVVQRVLEEETYVAEVLVVAAEVETSSVLAVTEETAAELVAEAAAEEEAADEEEPELLLPEPPTVKSMQDS